MQFHVALMNEAVVVLPQELSVHFQLHLDPNPCVANCQSHPLAVCPLGQGVLCH